jgi:transcriptional regulator GlxA family with amidase domain
MRRIVITGPPPVQILDVAGPLEAFANLPDYQITLCTPGDGSTLETSRGFSIGGAVALKTVTGPIDTLLIAGGPGAESGSYDAELIQWIVASAPHSRRIAAICTGAFVVAKAGLLNGRQAVTHWSFCARLAREFPSLTIRPDPIFLRDGNVYTSAGITAGIDLSLALIEEDHGHSAALAVARQLVMFLVRPGGQAQYSHMLSRQTTASQPVRELQVWMLEHLQDDLSVERLADRIGMSPRHFTRVCLRETGMNPGQLADRMRVEAAQQMIDASNMGLKEIAEASGFRTADSMRRVFLRVLGVTAGEYTRRFKR